MLSILDMKLLLSEHITVNYNNSAMFYIVYTQDEVTVNVIQLEGVKIFAPLKRLQTDTQVCLLTVS